VFLLQLNLSKYFLMQCLFIHQILITSDCDPIQATHIDAFCQRFRIHQRSTPKGKV
jgi:hypothetical protein